MGSDKAIASTAKKEKILPPQRAGRHFLHRQDKGAVPLLARLGADMLLGLNKIIADKAYAPLAGRCRQLGLDLEVAPGIKARKGFETEPLRWIVERTISWLMWDRRLCKDYEATTRSAEAFVYLSNIRRTLRNF